MIGPFPAQMSVSIQPFLLILWGAPRRRVKIPPNTTSKGAAPPTQGNPEVGAAGATVGDAVGGAAVGGAVVAVAGGVGNAAVGDASA